MDKRVIIVVKGIIKHRNEIIIVKRSKEEPVGAGNWEFPGGKVNFGEKLDDGVLREIKEETNLDVTIKKVLYTWSYIISQGKQIIGVTYICDSKSQDVTLSFEHCEYKWVNKYELKDYISPSIVKDLKKYGWL